MRKNIVFSLWVKLKEIIKNWRDVIEKNGEIGQQEQGQTRMTFIEVFQTTNKYMYKIQTEFVVKINDMHTNFYQTYKINL